MSICDKRKSSGSTERREHGFKRRASELFPGSEIAFYRTGKTSENAENKARNFFTCMEDEGGHDCLTKSGSECCKLKRQVDNKSAIVFFAPNESSAEGLVKAFQRLRENTKLDLGHVFGIGFDFTETLRMDLLSVKPFYAAVIRQDPREIGRRSVALLASHLRGKSSTSRT